MVIYDDEDPCWTYEDCECCGCDEDVCCCRFLTEYQQSYWGPVAGYSQISFPLYVEIIDYDCKTTKPCSSASPGLLDGLNGCLTASSEFSSNYCGGKKWTNQTSPIATPCFPNVSYIFTLRCAIVSTDPHTTDPLANCDSRRWVLSVNQNNADCEDGDPGYYKYIGSYLNQTGPFEYCQETFVPSCTNNNEADPGKGTGSVDIYFIIPAPYNDPDRTTFNQCPCCDAPEQILIHITYDEALCSSV